MPQAVINKHCPWSGEPVKENSLAGYRGYTVGFCNPGCRDKFMRACRMFDQHIERLDDGSLKQGLIRQAMHNQRMNRGLFAAVVKLADQCAEFGEDALGRAVADTLSRSLAEDIVWLQRFAKHSIDSVALEPAAGLSRPTLLKPYSPAEFNHVQACRQQTDEMLLAFIQSVQEYAFNAVLSYTDGLGQAFRQSLVETIQDLFNRQIYYQGQAASLLSLLGIEPPGITLGQESELRD